MSELEDDYEVDIVLIDETFKVLDDAHQKICFEIRERLRPINRYVLILLPVVESYFVVS